MLHSYTGFNLVEYTIILQVSHLNMSVLKTAQFDVVV